METIAVVMKVHEVMIVAVKHLMENGSFDYGKVIVLKYQ